MKYKSNAEQKLEEVQSETKIQSSPMTNALSCPETLRLVKKLARPSIFRLIELTQRTVR